MRRYRTKRWKGLIPYGAARLANHMQFMENLRRAKAYLSPRDIMESRAINACARKPFRKSAA